MFRYGRDFGLAILAVFLEAIVKAICPNLAPFLPYALFLILVLLTLDFIHWPKIRKFASTVYERWGAKHVMISYIVVSVIGAGLFSFYWWGIGRVLSEPAKTNETAINPVKRKAVALSSQVLDFCDKWQKKEPKIENFEGWNITGLKDNPEAQKKWHAANDAYTQASQAWWRGMSREFVLRYAGSITALRDELATLGQRSDKLDHTLERNITWGCYPSDMRVIATELQQLAEKVKD